MSLVPGDPGSLSACAATVGSLAARLADQARGLAPELGALADGWPGRASVAARRRGATLGASAATTADELEQLARLLQDRATDLADLLARARALEERLATAGLAVRDDRVVPAYGVRGEADPVAVAAAAGSAERLQGELDLLLAQHRRRRDFVLSALRASTARLDALSHELRRG